MPPFATSRTIAATQTHRSTACRASELKIIQEQVGHQYASTTAIYSGVSDEYRNRLVQRALQARHSELWEPEREVVS
jgi:integrase